MRTRKIVAASGLIAAGLVLAAACSNEDASGEGGTGIKALALASDGTDVEGIRFDVTPVSCEDGSPLGPTTTEVEPIDPDQTVPGNIPELKNHPLDKNSSHLFADSFQVLPAGCYNVVATPVQDDEDPSEDCARAFKKGVVVKQGLTTEIFMINQCEGEDPGAADIIAALNHEPMLEDVNFSDSKFSCGSPTEICAEGSDPDSDPIEIVLSSDDCEVEALSGDDPTVQCWELTCSSVGKHNLKVTVYDLLHGTTSDPQRIEDWLAEEGYPNESHAELSFHAYVDGTELWPDVDGDGHGDANSDATVFCEGDDTDGYVPTSDDCDDSAPTTYPGAEEICDDGVDNDCDGAIDECALRCDSPWVCDGQHQIQVCHNCPDGGASYCFKTDDGTGLCTDDFACSDKPKCGVGFGDCAEGSECVIDSCCDEVGSGVGTCGPVKNECTVTSTSSGSSASHK